MAGLFSGGGGSKTTSSSSSSTTNYTPEYNDYVSNILQKAKALGDTPFQAYDVNKRFADFTPDQQLAFQNIRNAPGQYQPYINKATGALDRVAGYDPLAAATPYLNRAGATPDPYAVGQGYLRRAGQSWNNPWVQSSYMNPYAGGALSYANDLSTQNFLEKTIPGVTDQFVKSGGQLGRSNYTKFMNRAVRDFTTNMMGQNNTAMSQNYWNAANQFNTDQSRNLNVGTSMGNLAQQNMGALGQLAGQASNITSGAVQTGANVAGAYSNLGGALSNLNNQNTNMLLQSGALQQQQAQKPLDFNYQQFQQQVQWPFQMVNFMRGAQAGLQIPTTTNTSGYTTQSGTPGSSSPFGTALGAVTGIMGIPGVADWTGGQLGKIFGSTGGGMVTSGAGGAMENYLGNIGRDPSYGGGGGFARGGAVRRRYAAGGQIATTRGALNQRMRGRPMMPPPGMMPRGPMPPGMPPMGALSAMGG